MVALEEQDIRYGELKKEIKKELDHLRNLYSKIDRCDKEHKSKTRKKSEADRVKRTESELKKKFPDMEFDRRLLRLVGAMQHKNPASKDKDLIARAIAERHYE